MLMPSRARIPTIWPHVVTPVTTPLPVGPRARATKMPPNPASLIVALRFFMSLLFPAKTRLL